MRSRGTWLIASAVLIAAGCNGSKPPPPTYTAGGKVVYADGEAPTGGTLQFQPQSAGSVSAFAEVGEDGKFTLSTIVDGRKIGGAVAGTFQATFIPPVGADQRGGSSGGPAGDIHGAGEGRQRVHAHHPAAARIAGRSWRLASSPVSAHGELARLADPQLDSRARTAEPAVGAGRLFL